AAAGGTCPAAPPAAPGDGDPRSVGPTAKADEAPAEGRFTSFRAAGGFEAPSLSPSGGAAAETATAGPPPSATRGCEAPAEAGSAADITDSSDTSPSWRTVA